MIKIGELLAIALLSIITPQNTGFLSAYGQLPTDATIAYRQELDQIPDDLSQFDTYIAVLDCTKIGATGELHTISGTLDIIVFDCAGTEDGGADWMIDGNYIAGLLHLARIS